MATSLTLEQTTFNSKNITRSVTNISSTANDSQLYEFAEAINGLTTNTLNKVNRIDKREITDEKYYNITATQSRWFNDGGKGTISDSGLTATISKANIADSTDTANQTYVEFFPQIYEGSSISVIINTQEVIFSCTTSLQSNAAVSYQDNVGIMVSFVAPESGTVTVTIPAGQVTKNGNVYKYNATTFTVTITE